MPIKKYIFESPSALSFKLMHKGRIVYINFSLPINGTARYYTEDAELVAKIKDHRWFRKGLIKVREVSQVAEVVRQQIQKPTVASQQVNPANRFSLARMGRVGAPYVPEMHNGVHSATTVPEETPLSPNEDEELIDDNLETGEQLIDTDGGEFPIDSVTTFLEAQQYLKEVYNIPAAEVKSKESVKKVCEVLKIEFPNLNL